MQIPFEEAVTAHGATVLRVCRAALGAGPDADDAWSETFLAALQAWPQLPADTNVQAWLVRVAQRKTIDTFRRRARHPVPTADVPEPEPADSADGADSGIWEFVAALPERQRLALAYHYFGGLAHTETARLLDATPESVRRAASDGLRALRDHLGAGQNERNGAFT